MFFIFLNFSFIYFNRYNIYLYINNIELNKLPKNKENEMILMNKKRNKIKPEHNLFHYTLKNIKLYIKTNVWLFKRVT